MFCVLPIETKREINNKLLNFQIEIKNLLNQKIKYIYLRRKMRNNAFDAWYKTISINWEPLSFYISQYNCKT